MAGVERFELPDDGVRGWKSNFKQPKNQDIISNFRYNLRPTFHTQHRAHFFAKKIGKNSLSERDKILTHFE